MLSKVKPAKTIYLYIRMIIGALVQQQTRNLRGQRFDTGAVPCDEFTPLLDSTPGPAVRRNVFGSTRFSASLCHTGPQEWPLCQNRSI